MSDVASLELSKELFELSGWMDTDVRQKYGADGKYWSSFNYFVKTDVPAYDLGYLLRKLQVVKDRFEEAKIGVETINTVWAAQYDNGLKFGTKEYHFMSKPAPTPEDAACKLAIALIKSGVIPIKEDRV